jgi:hypothetical protein
MGAKMVSLRLDEELLEWADAYAKEREVSRTALLESALVSFREDCKAGVPALREAARRQSSVPAKTEGVGECPFHGAWEGEEAVRHPGETTAYRLRLKLNAAVRELRDGETADRIRDIYERVSEDVLNGRVSKPPLLQRLREAEAENRELRAALERYRERMP